MSNIPSNPIRLPNLLSFQNAQRTLAGTSRALFDVQNQLYTGRRFVNASDDPISASLASVLRDRIAGSEQRLRNLSHAGGALSSLDQALGEAKDLTVEALSIASSQIGVGSDAETREAQANVIQSITRSMLEVANREFVDLHLFAGDATGRPPFEEFFGGVRYVGRSEGLRTDLGSRVDAPITLGGETAFGSLSSRVEGDVDLNPAAGRETRIVDLGGARGEGVALGSVDVTIDDGVTPVTVSVDLTEAENAGDVLDAIESAIRGQDPAALGGAFPSSGVSAGDALTIPAAAGYTITFADVGAGTTAADLGLGGFSFTNGTPTNPAGDLQPRISQHTSFGSLNPAPALTLPGSFVIENGGRTGTVTLAAGDTVGDFIRQVASLNLGVRAEVNEAGDGLNLINEVSGFEMSVREDGGGSLLATGLGLRTLRASTAISDFNHGRGVEIADGVINPLTGLPDPNRNVDFRVNLRDGTSFDVDLTPADLGTVQDVLDAINAAAAGAGYAVPADFEATLADGANGITFVDSTGPASQETSVTRLNGHAAEDLGLLDGAFTAGAPAVLAGSDRASVRVESVFSDLIDLRASLDGNDERGIVVASGRLEADDDRLIAARAAAGGRAQRVEDARTRVEDETLLDETIRSGLEDVDFTEAATRFSLLQLAQNAAFAATARTQGLTLLNFL
jgi:flagellin-like hook-associated protein FlgL